ELLSEGRHDRISARRRLEHRVHDRRERAGNHREDGRAARVCVLVGRAERHGWIPGDRPAAASGRARYERGCGDEDDHYLWGGSPSAADNRREGHRNCLKRRLSGWAVVAPTTVVVPAKP